MPRTEEANQRIREAQRAKILEAARNVFARHGLTATMAEVATEAGVSYGLAYRYFVNKEALFRALVEQSFQGKDMAFQRLEALPGTPGEHLERLITGLVTNRRDHPDILQLHAHVLSDPATPAVLRDQAIAYGQIFQETLRRLIVAGQTEGSVRTADPDQLVTAVLAALDGLTRLALIDPERFQQHFPDASIILGMLKPS